MILNQKKPENFHLKKFRPQFSGRDRLFTVPLSLHCFATGAVTIRGKIFRKKFIHFSRLFVQFIQNLS